MKLPVVTQDSARRSRTAPGLRPLQLPQEAPSRLSPVESFVSHERSAGVSIGAGLLLGLTLATGVAQAAAPAQEAAVSVQKDQTTKGEQESFEEIIQETIEEKIEAQQPQQEVTPGEETEQSSGRTALQKQVDFFDTNQDQKITLGETYRGMRSIGVGRAKSVLVSLITNGAFGYASGSPWHSPLTVRTETIHEAKHGGDTDVYNNEGLFDAERFEAIFEHDLNGDGALSETELAAMLESRRDEDGFGARASKAGFGLLMEVGGEDQGGERVLTRETLTEFYEGTLFYRLSGRELPAN